MLLPRTTLALLLLATSGLAAQPSGPTEGTIGAVIVAHGGGPEWNAQVERVAAEVRLPGPVGIAFLMGPGAKTHRFQDVVADVVRRGAREVVIVPLLVSSHSGHYEQVRWLAGLTDSLDAAMRHHLHMGGLDRPAATVPLRLAPALDDAAEVAEVIAARARALATEPAAQALFVVGHGPNSAEDDAAWMRNLRPVAEQARAQAGLRHVLVGFVRDDAPPPVREEAVRRVRELIALQREATGRDVVVVPVLVAPGKVSRETLPRDLQGLPIAWSGEVLLPHPAMARWVEASVRRAATTSLTDVSGN